MDKAYVDTTILTDVLLKSGEPKKRAEAALACFNETELPVYAIKEFKAGPLKNFVWMHNKFVTTDNFAQAMSALHRMSRTPRRYTTSTALEAVVKAASSIANETPLSLAKKYGETSIDEILRDEYRLALKMVITKAWTTRRSVTTRVVQPLACYDELPPFEERGLIELDPMQCRKGEGCCLGPALKSNTDVLKKMREAIIHSGNEKRENITRRQALGEIIRLPKLPITQKICKVLGDVMFAFFAPQHSKILTTNYEDHKLLAESIGKKVERPI